MKSPTILNFWLLLIFSLVGCSYTQETQGTVLLKTALRTVGPYVPFLNVALDIWDKYDELNGGLSAESEYEDPSEELAELTRKIDEICRDLNYFYDDISSSIDEINENMKLDDKMVEFIDDVSEIEQTFKGLVLNIEFENFTYKTIEGSINRILREDDMVVKLGSMVETLKEARDNNDHVFKLLKKENLKRKLVCSYESSVQQTMYSIFEIAHETQIKGLIMLIFAYQADVTKTAREQQKGIGSALSAYFNHTISLTELLQREIEYAPQDMWRCNPEQAVEGKTYERFGRAFQKYLLNMKNVDPLGILESESCHATCDDVPNTLYQISYTQKVFHGWSSTPENEVTRVLTASESRRKEPIKEASFSYGGGYQSNTTYPFLEAKYSLGIQRGKQYLHDDVDSNRCYEGHITACTTIKEREIEMCKADPGQIERYSYMKYGKSVFGNKCLDPIKISTPNTKSKSGNDIPCSYCMCTCDYGEKSASSWQEMQKLDTDRYIDLYPVEADAGFVVTGVRIKKDSPTHTFYIEIKQAQLLPRGRVAEAEWKETTTYYPRELKNNSEPLYKENEDYHKITNGKTAFILDQYEATQDNQFITGLNFIPYNIDGIVYLGLSVKFQEADLTTGELSEDEVWLPESPPTSAADWYEVSVEDLEAPTKSNKQNTQITDYASYVKLANSKLEYDVGQNILPFIDIQKVETNPPIPLTGIGLYHRGSPHSGGYLGLKVKNLNLASHLPDIYFLKEQRSQVDSLKNKLTATQIKNGYRPVPSDA